MSRYLTVFFSAGGTTARAARAVAGAVDADLFEIRPAVSYTAADLNWNNPASRTSVEMNDEACRPELASAEVPDLTEYDAVFVGFPIWWYVEPRIVDSFLDRCSLEGVKLIPFATSGGSGISSWICFRTILRRSCGRRSRAWGDCRLLQKQQHKTAAAVQQRVQRCL